MKLVISDTKTGKTYQVEVAKENDAFILNKKIGETLQGDSFGAAGYTLEITGGSDTSGFPMRKDIYGTRKVRAHLSGGVGFNPKRQGARKNKMVRGNEVAQDTAQVNLKVVKAGVKPLDEIFGKKEAEEKKE